MIIELRHIIGFVLIWMVPAWVTLFIIWPKYKKELRTEMAFAICFTLATIFGMFFLVLIEKPPKQP